MRIRFLRPIATIMFVLTLLTSCSAVRLAYNNAPQFSWWWLDSYFDFGSDHAPRVKEGIEQWFVWHRQTQLLAYADWMAAVERQFAGPTTAAQVCALYDQARQLMQPALERALEAAADSVHGVGPAQIAHLEQRYAKLNAEMRREHLEREVAERRKAALKRMVDRAERVYGHVDDAQRRLLEAAAATSPLDPGRWLAERERRQRDLLQALRRWQADRPERAQLLAAMRHLAERAERGHDAPYRAYQQRLKEDNCRVSAELHNLATPAQRQAGRRQLKSWEEDLRALAGDRQP